MTPQEFIKKWGPGGPAYALNERSGAQAHFMDLCALLGVATPGDVDNYCFERGVTKTGTGKGFADVWMRNHFGWEYKAPGKSLDGALILLCYLFCLSHGRQQHGQRGRFRARSAPMRIRKLVMEDGTWRCARRTSPRSVMRG